MEILKFKKKKITTLMIQNNRTKAKMRSNIKIKYKIMIKKPLYKMKIKV